MSLRLLFLFCIIVLSELLTQRFIQAQEPEANPDSSASLVRTQPEHFRIKVNGTQYFSADNIQFGLMTNPDLMEELRKAENAQQRAQTLMEQIQEGFQRAGILMNDIDIQVQETEAFVLFGSRTPEIYRLGEIEVLHDDESIRASLQHQLRQSVMNQNDVPFLGDDREPGLPSLYPGAPFYPLEEAQHDLKKAIEKYLARDGFLFANFEAMYRIDASQKRIIPTIHLQSLGNRQPISEVQIAGLQMNGQDEVLKYLDLSPELYFSQDLVKRIRRKLLDSGRFLSVRVWHEHPFSPDHAVPLHIDVVEYDYGPGLNDQLSDIQEFARSFGVALSRWHRDPKSPDLTVDAEFSLKELSADQTGLMQAFTQSGVHVSNIGSLAFRGMSPDNRCRIRGTLSPKGGAIIHITILDPAGQTIDTRTFALADSFMAVAYPMSGNCWMTPEGPQYCSIMLTLNGKAPDDENDPRRADFRFGAITNSRRVSGLQLLLTCTPAALIHLFKEDSESPATLTRQGTQSIVESKKFTCKLQQSEKQTSFELQMRPSADVKLTFATAKGAFDKELAESVNTFRTMKNHWSAEAWIPSLVQLHCQEMLNSDSHSTPIVSQIMAELANNPDMVRELLSFFPEYTRTGSFELPESGEFLDKPPAGFDTIHYCLQRMGPLNSGCGQLAVAIKRSVLMGNREAWQTLIKDAVNPPGWGPLDSLVLAYMGSNASHIVAKAGLERLDQDTLMKDLDPYLTEHCLLKTLISILVRRVQHMPAEDFEVFVKDLDTRFRDSFGMKNDATTRPVLVLIRSQKESQASLRDQISVLVPILWQAGLRDVLERQLRAIAYPEPGPFREVSASKSVDEK